MCFDTSPGFPCFKAFHRISSFSIIGNPSPSSSASSSSSSKSSSSSSTSSSDSSPDFISPSNAGGLALREYASIISSVTYNLYNLSNSLTLERLSGRTNLILPDSNCSRIKRHSPQTQPKAFSPAKTFRLYFKSRMTPISK